MARPPSINQLLSKVGKPYKSNGSVRGNDLEKPKYLSKAERQALVSSRISKVEITSAVSLNAEKKRQRSYEDMPALDDASKVAASDTGGTAKKRYKFQFEWQDSDDTLSGYSPIVETKVTTLLPGAEMSDSLEYTYIGKHWTGKALREMTDRDWRIFNEDFGIRTKGGSVERPMRNWSELKLLAKDMLTIITEDLKYTEPTPIQRVAIPNTCKVNRDFLGVASTGSGKTLAFVIPILIKMSNAAPRPVSLKKLEGPKALILAPTRELAQQIQKEAQKFTLLWNTRNPSYSCKVVSIVGGHSMEEITQQLSYGCDILVATPGRLIESLENHLFSSRGIETLVLDEADKMIDMGFEEQVTTILSKLNSFVDFSRWQTLMFTATMSPTIEKIANGYLRKPVYATIGSPEESTPQIQQIVKHVQSEEQRFKQIKGLLNTYKSPIIIFITYKKTADWLAQKFYAETSLRVTILHGSKSQEQREHSLQQLRSGKCQVMVATNVAARGLDIPNVSLVINFQMPKTFDDYIHRIGRTGRAGKSGTAISYLGDEESPEIVEELYKYVESNNPTKSNTFDKALKNMYNLGRGKYDEIIY